MKKETEIHPTAIIDSSAELGENVKVGPYTIIKPDTVIGDNTVIGPHVVIDQYSTIGSDCEIFQYASVGAAPQDLKFTGEKTYLKVGNGSIIREFVTINRGTGVGGGITEVGKKNYLMAYVHVAHDCKTGHSVILANNATLAGHIILGNHVTIGGLVAVHQFVQIGDHAYVGGKSVIVKDVPPFVIASGDRAILHGLNKVGLKRRGFSSETMSELKKAYRIVFRIGLTLSEAVERVKAELDQSPEVINFIEFVKSSTRGITR